MKTQKMDLKLNMNIMIIEPISNNTNIKLDKLK